MQGEQDKHCGLLCQHCMYSCRQIIAFRRTCRSHPESRSGFSELLTSTCKITRHNNQGALTYFQEIYFVQNMRLKICVTTFCEEVNLLQKGNSFLQNWLTVIRKYDLHQILYCPTNALNYINCRFIKTH